MYKVYYCYKTNLARISTAELKYQVLICCVEVLFKFYLNITVLSRVIVRNGTAQWQMVYSQAAALITLVAPFTFELASSKVQRPRNS